MNGSGVSWKYFSLFGAVDGIPTPSKSGKARLGLKDTDKYYWTSSPILRPLQISSLKSGGNRYRNKTFVTQPVRRRLKEAWSHSRLRRVLINIRLYARWTDAEVQLGTNEYLSYRQTAKVTGECFNVLRRVRFFMWEQIPRSNFLSRWVLLEPTNHVMWWLTLTSVADPFSGSFFKSHTREMILMLKVNISLQLF